jgi:hypothetical protein
VYDSLHNLTGYSDEAADQKTIPTVHCDCRGSFLAEGRPRKNFFKKEEGPEKKRNGEFLFFFNFVL